MYARPVLDPPNSYDGMPKFRTHSFLKREFESLGCTVSRVGPITQVEKAGRSCYLFESETSFTSLLAARIFKNKALANRFLRRCGLNVAEQHLFAKEDLAGARKLVARMGTCVVKPLDGNRGRGVTVGATPDTIEEAWEAACAESRSGILIESKFPDAVEARYLVIDGRCVAVIQRIPPHIVGDGATTVGALIEARNKQRMRNPSLMHRPIRIDAHRRVVLAEQGLTLESIPEEGHAVLIDSKAGLSTGGEARNITDDVHVGMKQVAEKVASVAVGMDVIGVDILAHDHAQAPRSDNYMIVEANTRPDLAGHHFPSYGTSINVCRLIAESCCAKMLSRSLANGPAPEPMLDAAPLNRGTGR